MFTLPVALLGVFFVGIVLCGAPLYSMSGKVTCNGKNIVNDAGDIGASVVAYVYSQVRGKRKMKAYGESMYNRNHQQWGSVRNGEWRNHFDLYGKEDESGYDWWPMVKVESAHCGNAGESETDDAGNTYKVWWFDVWPKCHKIGRQQWDCSKLHLELSDSSVSTYSDDKKKKAAGKKKTKEEQKEE